MTTGELLFSASAPTPLNATTEVDHYFHLPNPGSGYRTGQKSRISGMAITTTISERGAPSRA